MEGANEGVGWGVTAACYGWGRPTVTSDLEGQQRDLTQPSNTAGTSAGHKMYGKMSAMLELWRDMNGSCPVVTVEDEVASVTQKF